MKETIILCGDLHKRAGDIATIDGYKEVSIDVENALMGLVKKLNATKIISLGDWYDSGYHNTSTSPIKEALLDVLLDLQLSNTVNGEFYGLIGNHIRIGYNSNPEVILIQPNDEYKVDTMNIKLNQQVLKTPDYLNINGVGFYFMHHNRNARNILDYKPTIREGDKIKVGLFHTEHVLGAFSPMFTDSTYSDCAEAFAGLDYAICGDIHKPYDDIMIGNCKVIIPGSLTNRNISKINRHSSIEIPVIEIGDNGEFTLTRQHFDLLTDRLKFRELEENTENVKMKSLRGKTLERTLTNLSMEGLAVTETSLMHIQEWMKTTDQYTETDIEMVKTIVKDPTNINRLLELYAQRLQEKNMKEGL